MSENDQRIAKELQKKIEDWQDFEPSGDLWNDCNEILKLSGGDKIYEKVNKDNLSSDEVLASLIGLKASWIAIEKTSKDVEYENPAKNLFFVKLPKEKIKTIDKVINFYISKASPKKKKKYEEVESFSNALYHTEETNEYYEKEENDNEREEDQELNAEEKALCAQWEKETKSLEDLKITGNINEDFNKVVSLLDEDNRFGKVDLTTKPVSVLLKFVEMKTTWQNVLDFYRFRPAEQKKVMKVVYLESMNRQNEKLKSFVDYYILKQDL